MTEVQVALAAFRWIHYASAMSLFGSSLLLWRMRGGELGARIAGSLRVPAIALAALALLSMTLWLPLESATIGGWAAATDVTMLRTVMLETNFGRAWTVRMALAVVTLAIVVAAPPRIRVLTVSAGLLLAALASSGHATMHDGPLGLLHGINDAIHALCAGAWLGSLIPFFACLRSLQDRATRKEAGQGLRSFSSMGHVAVAGVLVTGVFNTLLVLGQWPVHWRSPYQALLAGKIALTVLMVAIAVFNRYVSVPRLAAEPWDSIRSIRRLTIAGLAMGVGVLVLVSLLGLLEPS
jgi:putative copper resistance protein D